jgi:DNA-binding NtrC family response regulator
LLAKTSSFQQDANGDAGGSGLPARGNDAEPAAARSETSPLEDVERETILRTLAAVSGNKSEAARRLQITRRTLHKKLKKYGMM